MARKTKKFELNDEQRDCVLQNLNLARREAWRIQRTTGIDYQTLEGVAFEGLCKACYRYDPDSGYKFSSLATPTIRGELLHWVRDKTYAIRLSHRMRELWVKGRKLLYKGASDIEVAKALDVSLEEWRETRSTCSGPPLELKDQAMPTEPLEPEEIDFTAYYFEKAAELISEMSDDLRASLINYFHGKTSKPPMRQFQNLITRLQKENKAPF